MKSDKYKVYIGVAANTLAKVKDLDYGILMIEAKVCRGIDTRFAKDAMVLITANVKSYHEYLQILGRSSRARNISSGILYTDTDEKPSQVMMRLKRQNITVMQNLEKLVIMI